MTHFCPVDHAPMTDQFFGSETIHRCSQCAGIFVPGRAVPELHAHTTLHLHQAYERAGSIKTTKIRCPVEAAEMIALMFKGVEIDVCTKCRGVWLDPGEFEKIARAVKVPDRQNGDKLAERYDEAQSTLDLADVGSNSDLGSIADAVSFIGDAVGSIFDGISF